MLKILKGKQKPSVITLTDRSNNRNSRAYLAKFRQTTVKLKLTNWELFMMLETQSLDEIRKEKLNE